MTNNKRIFLNVVATYGRSLFSMLCGLFTARWVLMALGEVDYGLYGLVGGLTMFVSFLNGQLAMAVGRFFAYSVGEAQRPENEIVGLESCRKWFTTAVVIHTVVPVVLVIVGYPCGIWAVKSFLTIPADRIESCVWVWRCVCVSCFVAMVTVPYQAMYTAKQEIAELTIYDFVRTSLNVVVLYYMVSHPSDWLVKYAVWMMIVNSVPSIIIGARAFIKYSECRICRGYLFCADHIRQIVVFSGWRLLNGIAMMCSSQGNAIVVNKYLGPSKNATMSVASSLAAQSGALSGGITGALYPVITNAAGANNLDLMRKVAFRACKFGALAILVFGLPLIFEADEVLRLWLKNPPDQSAMMCAFILVCTVLEKITDGHAIAIFAVGRIGAYQMTASIAGFSVLAISLGLLSAGFGLVGVGISMLCGQAISQCVRLYYGHREAGMSPMYWARRVFLPIASASAVSVPAGMLVTRIFESSFLRVVVTTSLIEAVFLPAVWWLALESDERGYLRNKLISIVSKVRND